MLKIKQAMEYHAHQVKLSPKLRQAIINIPHTRTSQHFASRFFSAKKMELMAASLFLVFGVAFFITQTQNGNPTMVENIFNPTNGFVVAFGNP